MNNRSVVFSSANIEMAMALETYIHRLGTEDFGESQIDGRIYDDADVFIQTNTIFRSLTMTFLNLTFKSAFIMYGLAGMLFVARLAYHHLKIGDRVSFFRMNHLRLPRWFLRFRNCLARFNVGYFICSKLWQIIYYLSLIRSNEPTPIQTFCAVRLPR